MLQSLITSFLLAAIPLHAQLSKQEPKDLNETRAKAEKGDPSDQFEFGYHQFDRGNLKEGVLWIQRSATNGFASAQAYLGFLYLQGSGVAKDVDLGLAWLRMGATNSHSTRAEAGRTQFVLGSFFAGDFPGVVQKDDVEAAKWLRQAATNGFAQAQTKLAQMIQSRRADALYNAEAVNWLQKASEQGDPEAQTELGKVFLMGVWGPPKDDQAALKWFLRAAEQGNASAQLWAAMMYSGEFGIPANEFEQLRWTRLAAEGGNVMAMEDMGRRYMVGDGVARDFLQAYKFLNLVAIKSPSAAKKRDILENKMSPEQISEAQRLARDWKPRRKIAEGEIAAPQVVMDSKPSSTGSGFFITRDGYFVTSQHVTESGSRVRLLSDAGLVEAKVVKVDKANDLALLKAEGNFTALPVITSRGVRLGGTAATVGFPNTGLQGFAPKLAKGEIASLAGVQDDARHFQISAPIQPGNSGGALVDERGNVIGVVVAKLSQKAALATSGTLAENVNYAVKSSYLLSFLESVPDVAAKLKDAHTKDRKFEDVVKSVEQATVLVLVY